MPNSTPTSSEAVTQKATTRRSNDNVTVAGNRPSGISTGATRRMAAPRAMPSAPPIRDSITLSVSNCRMMRRRPAPSAARTASSRVRAVARARSKFATFPQQISSTNPTTPRKSMEVVFRSLPIIVSRRGSMRDGAAFVEVADIRAPVRLLLPSDPIAPLRPRRPA